MAIRRPRMRLLQDSTGIDDDPVSSSNIFRNPNRVGCPVSNDPPSDDTVIVLPMCGFTQYSCASYNTPPQALAVAFDYEIHYASDLDLSDIVLPYMEEQLLDFMAQQTGLHTCAASTPSEGQVRRRQRRRRDLEDETTRDLATSTTIFNQLQGISLLPRDTVDENACLSSWQNATTGVDCAAVSGAMTVFVQANDDNQSAPEQTALTSTILRVLQNHMEWDTFTAPGSVAKVWFVGDRDTLPNNYVPPVFDSNGDAGDGYVPPPPPPADAPMGDAAPPRDVDGAGSSPATAFTNTTTQALVIVAGVLGLLVMLTAFLIVQNRRRRRKGDDLAIPVKAQVTRGGGGDGGGAVGPVSKTPIFRGPASDADNETLPTKKLCLSTSSSGSAKSAFAATTAAAAKAATKSCMHVPKRVPAVPPPLLPSIEPEFDVTEDLLPNALGYYDSLALQTQNLDDDENDTIDVELALATASQRPQQRSISVRDTTPNIDETHDTVRMMHHHHQPQHAAAGTNTVVTRQSGTTTTHTTTDDDIYVDSDEKRSVSPRSLDYSNNLKNYSMDSASSARYRFMQAAAARDSIGDILDRQGSHLATMQAAASSSVDSTDDDYDARSDRTPRRVLQMT